MDRIPILTHVVRQHIQELADCYHRRETPVSPLALSDLARADERLAGHLDGLAAAGPEGIALAKAELSGESSDLAFVVALRAIAEKQRESLEEVVDSARTMPGAEGGLLSAFGWLEPDRLQGLVAPLLASSDACDRAIGIAACALHRVDPGLIAARRLQDSSPLVRARALRTAGEIGLLAAAPQCAAAIDDEHDDVRFWAAWSSVLLGNRGQALSSLTRLGLQEGGGRQLAFRLALQAMEPGSAHALLRRLAGDPAQLRWLIEGSGIAGDPVYVPWLIGHMANPEVARLAGEAFSLIAGVDLDRHLLRRERPEGFESGPTDNPEDADVELDPDEGLHWPDGAAIEKWWAANSNRFQKGERYFMGAPVTREHCLDVLRSGFQRQRVLAAHYLCLLEPGTPLFNTSAPAWRQQRLLAQMK